MSKVYMLIATDTKGNVTLEGTFTSDPELAQHLSGKGLLEFDDGSPKLKSGYSVKVVELRSAGPSAKYGGLGWADAGFKPKRIEPDFWVEVKSYTTAGVAYSVGLKINGHVMSCSCPHFRERLHYAGQACKHMQEVYYNPGGYNVITKGIGRLENEEGY